MKALLDGSFSLPPELFKHDRSNDNMYGVLFRSSFVRGKMFGAVRKHVPGKSRCFFHHHVMIGMRCNRFAKKALAISSLYQDQEATMVKKAKAKKKSMKAKKRTKKAKK
jgi:hypothetical protein